jgi:hypothetical protein
MTPSASRSLRSGPGQLWAITSYFNPAAYRSRLWNFRIFRRHLPVPLVAVELSFDGRFELGAGDADQLVQIHGGDVMWQKERLLNVALASLPRGCDTVAWIDGDVVFGQSEWPREARRALDQQALVHLFHERCDLPRQVDAVVPADWAHVPTSRSVVFKMSVGQATPDDLAHGNAPVLSRSTAGLAWASRRDVLERHGFYDACILGTGDRVMLCAALGRFDFGIRAALMNPARAAHYRAWAGPFFETVRGRVACIPGTAYHLWHGDFADRRYEERHRLLEHFDPAADIALDANGCWRWNSAQPAMHALIRRYFELRDEDRPGRGAAS